MARYIIDRNTSKASTKNPSVKPPPGYKTLEIETAIILYEIEDNYKDE